MAKFVAYVAVDTSNLIDLALLGDIHDNLKFPNTIVLQNSFNATEKGGPAKLHITGEAMTITGTVPIEGVVKGIEITHTDTGEHQYDLTKLSLFFGTIQNSFKGDFESDLFQRDDQMIGSAFDDTLKSYSGDDKVFGGKGIDNLYGGGGNDNLNGGVGDDNIYGQGDNDDIDGGKGNDNLFGGNGQNNFIFDTVLDAATNVDTIGDYSVGDNSFDLSKAIFAGIGSIGQLSKNKFVVGTDAGDSKDLIIYDATNGHLYFDADGSGAGAKVLFAIVTDAPTLTFKDFDVIA